MFYHVSQGVQTPRWVLEPDVERALTNYYKFIETGKVHTKHTEPKVLGETAQVLCLDKPLYFTCSFGDKGQLPEVTGAETAMQLLNGKEDTVQVHEYLALKFNHETARCLASNICGLDMIGLGGR